MNKLRIVTINVRGIREKKKRFVVINWLKKKAFDIICLQETYVTKEFLPIIEKDFLDLGKYYSSCSDSVHSRGVGIILSRKMSEWNVHSIHTDAEGRKILVNIENIHKECLSVSSLYVPNNLNMRIQFMNECHKWLQNCAINEQNVVITGDFNACYNECDRASGKLDKSCHYFKDFILKNDLIDTFRLLNPESKGFTYVHTSDSARNSRIDYIFVPSRMIQSILCSSVLPCPAPDHKALSLTLCFNRNKRGSGYWKLNNSLLHDEAYKTLIRSDITHAIKTYGTLISKQELIELIKVIVKESSVHFFACKKARRVCRISQIETELNSINNEFGSSSNPGLLIKRKSLKNELDMLYQDDSTAAYIRSRAKWVEQGEKSTSYFLKLKNHHQSTNCINILKNDDGNKLTADKEILAEIRKFYTKLYSSTTSETENIEKYFSELETPKTLSQIDSESIEGKITKEECEKALHMMKGNKSPGFDGISVEFYKTFWLELGDLVVDSFNEAYQKKLLTDSQNISILSLIFKKGDPSNIRNYRPISLTNTDYKLLAHILANRLHTVLHKIVSTDQTGYI